MSGIGAIAEKYINNTDKKHENAHVDEYVIKLGHINMIIALKNGAMWASPPTDGMAGASPPTDAFVTICTLHRHEMLGRIVGGDAHIAPPVLLSEIGTFAEKYINNIDTKHENSALVLTKKMERARHMDDRKIGMPYRKQMRLKEYDYSQAGYYFATICTLHRHEMLGRIVGGDAHIAPPVLLSEIGAIAEKYINNIDTKHEN